MNQAGNKANGAATARTDVLNLYGNRLRVRVCGLYQEGDRLLMVRHRGLGSTGTFWSPPGGGVEFGETVPGALIREFKEETGLDVEVVDLLFVNEFIQPPLHALELFFKVTVTGGLLRQGIDPEMSADAQLIDDVRLMTFGEIKDRPSEEVHAVFQHCQSLEDMFRLRGYLMSL